MKLNNILVATDFSPAAELAIRRAVTLAQRNGAALRVAHVAPPQRWLSGLFPSKRQWSEQVRARAAASLTQLAQRLAQEGRIDVSTALLTGNASGAIVDAAKQFAADLVVVGARGEGQLSPSRGGLGNTAAKLLRNADTPLLLVRRDDANAPSKALAALDLSPASKRVAQWSRALVGKGQLTAIHVFDAPFAHRLRGYGVTRKSIDVYAAEQQAERERELRAVLAEAGVTGRVEKIVARGEVAKTLTQTLRKLKCDTLAIGKHARRKRDPAAPHGGVCHYLAYFSTVDVLIAP